ncbi:PTS sugar transporter subunit IIA [Rubrimonas cliftonensis]|uniref:PTS system, mannose-specific IIA component n=1 Tax=Rubrimonas cliftonensis TaxID=89524 RepID=A0A1H3VPU5_9RHOB|nr:PTS fructose transporter subunit IIA [Rubrimonas cliftonensis]SDZ76845.1 PTS system, mannose-specific IIA component [Rubrimonas cliftonensis]
MIGLVIVAHGGLARELLAATEHVVGPLERAVAVSTAPADDLRAKQAEINAAVAAVDTGHGVALVTDMFGGTPCNLAIGAMSSDGVEVVYGANLPLLVKLAKMRERPLAEATDAAIEAGRKYIDGAKRMLDTVDGA